MKVSKRFDPHVKASCFNIQQVPTVLAIAREEMKVVARDAERTRKSRGPDANSRAVYFSESELRLCLRRFGEAHPPRRRIDRSRPNASKVSIQSYRVEDISRDAMLIAELLEILKARDGPTVDADLRGETSHYGKRRTSVRRSF